MARIEICGRTNTTFHVRLVDLDEKYNGSKRKVSLYIRESSNADWTPLYGDTIPNKCSYTQVWNIDGLIPDTPYIIMCYVTNISSSTPKMFVTEEEKTNKGFLRVDYYDYDGAMIAFGTIEGISNVKGVRMYTSLGNNNTDSYYSTQIYGKDEAYINPNEYSSPCYSFYIRTDRDAELKSPKQLDYDDYKISFDFYNDSGFVENLTPFKYGFDNLRFRMHNKLQSPEIIWDEEKKLAKLSNVGQGRYMLEIRRKDRNKVNTNFLPEIKDYAYTIGMKNLERGKYWEAIPSSSFYGEDGYEEDLGDFCRYRNIWMETDGEYDASQQRVGILFDSGASFTNNQKRTYTRIINEALEYITEYSGINFDVESLINDFYDETDWFSTAEQMVDEYGIYTDYMFNVIIRIGNNDSMGVLGVDTSGDYEDFYITGMSQCWGDGSEYVYESVAMINVEESEKRLSLKNMILQEIIQSFGLSSDEFDRPFSMYFQPNVGILVEDYDACDPYYQTSEFQNGIPWVEQALKFWYARDMGGWTNIQLLNEMDTPCVMFKEYDSKSDYIEFDLSELNPDEYEIYAWVAREKTSNTLGAIKTGDDYYYYISLSDNSPYSLKSSIEISISDEYIPTNLRCTRIKKGFIIEWDSVSGASGYNLQILKNGEIVSQYKNTKVLSQTLNWLDYATEYTIQVQSVKSDGTTSSWAVLTTATAPSVPIISLVSHDSNKVIGAWKLEAPESDFTYLYVTLEPIEGG